MSDSISMPEDAIASKGDAPARKDGVHKANASVRTSSPDSGPSEMMRLRDRDLQQGGYSVPSQETLDSACKDNPDLPEDFVCDSLIGIQQAKDGNVSPFEFASEICDNKLIEKAFGEYKAGWEKYGVEVTDSDSHAFTHGFLACREARSVPEPVSISLKDADRAYGEGHYRYEVAHLNLASAAQKHKAGLKAVLDEAGVPYVD